MKIKLLIVASILSVAVASIPNAFSTTGTYSLKAKGASGIMTVTETGVYPKVLKVEIQSATDEGNCCMVEASEQRITTSDKEIVSLFIIADGNGTGKFMTTFTPKGAIIEVSDDGGLCGSGAFFDGKWIKGKAKKSAK